MGLNAGRLRHKVEIWRYQEVETEIGSVRNELCRIKTVYGELKPTRGNEYLEYYKDMHELVYKFTIRYWADLRPTDVLVFRGKQYLINSIINVNELDYIQEVMCTEKLDKQKPEAKDGNSSWF